MAIDDTQIIKQLDSLGYCGQLSFDITVWYCQYQLIISDTENYQSMWHQTHYDVTDEITSDLKISTLLLVILSVLL